MNPSQRPSSTFVDWTAPTDKDFSSVFSMLPAEPHQLQQLVVDILISYNQLSLRCQTALKKTISEKIVLKERLERVEKRLAIKDDTQSSKFHEMLKALEEEKEDRAVQVNSLKKRIRELEEQVVAKNIHIEQLNMQIQAFSLSNLNSHHSLSSSERHTPHQRETTASPEREEPERKSTTQREQEKRTTLVSAAKDMERITSNLMGKTIEEEKSSDFHPKNISNKSKENTTEQILATHHPESPLFSANKSVNDSTNVSHNSGISDEPEPTDVIFVKDENGKKKIKAATFEAITRQLIVGGSSDFHFLTSFLLTYTLYVNAIELLDLLQNYYANPKLVSASSDEKNPKSPVRIRIINTVKHWVENYWTDFQDDETCQERLTEFIAQIGDDKLRSLLETAIVKASSKKAGTAQPERTTVAAPKPILPKILSKMGSNASESRAGSTNNVSSSNDVRMSAHMMLRASMRFDGAGNIAQFRFSDLDPIEIARQLTLIEFELFGSIRPREFVDLSWTKPDKETKAPGILKMAHWSNHVVHWFTSEIVNNKDSAKARVAAYEKIVLVAQQLEKLNNFNGVKEALAALQSSAVFRLRRTKDGVSGKISKLYEELCRLASSEMNYKMLRQRITQSETPLIPFPGVYQGDLVFLETCLKNHTEDGMVNYPKMEKLSSYILEIVHYQRSGYNLEPVPEIQEYIKTYSVYTDEEAYTMSLACEPRNG